MLSLSLLRLSPSLCLRPLTLLGVWSSFSLIGTLFALSMADLLYGAGKHFSLTASAKRKHVIYKNFKSLIEITSTASCRQITRALQGRKWQGDRGRPSFKTVGALALLQEMVHPAFFFGDLFMRCQRRGHGHKP